MVAHVGVVGGRLADFREVNGPCGWTMLIHMRAERLVSSNIRRMRLTGFVPTALASSSVHEKGDLALRSSASAASDASCSLGESIRGEKSRG